MCEPGSFASDFVHHSESPVNSNVPLRSRTSATGGRKGAATICSDATCISFVGCAGSARRMRGIFALIRSKLITFW